MALMIVGVDAGRNGIKVVGDGVREYFPACLGAYLKPKLEVELSRTDMVVDYAGQQYYVGGIAKIESPDGTQMMIKSKVHLDTKIFVLTALHRVVPDRSSIFLVTGEPIENHTAGEKLRLKQLLLGDHTITVNQEEKSFSIVRVEVAAEAATFGWALRRTDRFHVVDPGGRTVNYATFQYGKWINRLSGSLDYGLDTVEINSSMFARMTVAELSKRLGSLSPIILIGGKASVLSDYFRQYTSDVEAYHDALYANAWAFREAGVNAIESARQAQ
ncbi:ParM/StbA family protein [Fodinisporobacter ferrooxydans]|uniref:ParM/StbA family protein n=1 Tax=Fodinisporobacter ferrooxydans TaxID=2901836 RepID=A0ABY4CNG8_9BACL|nr:ParM/StbA family protein [Alicyclobacillaceae bacterium MYW30-H2]